MNLSCTFHSPAQVPVYLLLLHQIKATTADPSSIGHQQMTFLQKPPMSRHHRIMHLNQLLNYRQQLSILHIQVGCEARARAAALSKALSLLASMRAFCSSVSSIFARLGPSLAAPSWVFCASKLTSFGADGSGISLLVPSPAGMQGSYCTSTAVHKFRQV